MSGVICFIGGRVVVRFCVFVCCCANANGCGDVGSCYVIAAVVGFICVFVFGALLWFACVCVSCVCVFRVLRYVCVLVCVHAFACRVLCVIVWFWCL